MARVLTLALTASIAASVGTIQAGTAFAQIAPAPAQGAESGPAIDRADAQAVIEAYYRFGGTGNFGRVVPLLAPMFDIHQTTQVAENFARMTNKVRGGELQMSVERVVERADWALAVIVLESRQPETGAISRSIIDQYMIKLDNAWHVAPRPIREHEGFQFFFNENSKELNDWWNRNRQELAARVADQAGE